jgi:molecular chaperone HtpG
MQVIEEEADLSLINQFVVNFFFTFLVSGRVVVTSKHDNNQNNFENETDKNFSIRKNELSDDLILNKSYSLSERRFFKFFEENKSNI